MSIQDSPPGEHPVKTQASKPPTQPRSAKPPISADYQANWWKQGIVLFIMAVVAGVGGYWLNHRFAAAGPGGPPAFHMPPAPVTIATPIEGEIVDWDEYSGHLASVESVDLHARVSGLVIAAPFAEGTFVKAGTVLYEIDPRPFQAELDARQAAIAEAKAQVNIDAIQFNKVAELLKQSASTRFEYDTAEAKLKRSEAAVQSAQAAAETTRLNLDWCKVTAPISGMIGRKLVTAGNIIVAGNGPGAATLLSSIWSVDPIYCYVDADERATLRYRQLIGATHPDAVAGRASIRSAQVPCYLQLPGETGHTHKGTLDFLNNRVDSSSGTERIRAVFANPDAGMSPGLFARMKIQASPPRKTLLVPDQAIGSNQDMKFVMTVDAQNKIEMKIVRIGGLFGSFRAVDGGLTTGDRVVINGLMSARPGAVVAPTPETLTPPPASVLLGEAAPATPPSPAVQPQAGTAP